MWHRVAPALSTEFTVVCADLRGYGSRGKAASEAGSPAVFEDLMALDMVRMMKAQGFSRFSVAGHDRGARVAYRMALDHADRIERLALMDVIPTGEALRRADVRSALAFWPWWLLAQPEPLPERLIMADPEIVVDNALGDGVQIGPVFLLRFERPTSKRFEIRRRYTQSVRSTEPPRRLTL